MTDTKTIGISSLISLALITVAMVTPGFFDNPQYYCQDESSIKECPGALSGGSATRCYLNEERSSWDYCSSGWVLIEDDRQIQEQPESREQVIVVSNSKEVCNSKGCDVI
jgi:hypothetical protein